MYRLADSPRIKNIERSFEDSIATILYNWHWKANLKHSEIGERLDIPRPTISRWFRKLGVPSQDSHKITNNNLLNVGPRCGPRAQPRVKKVRPVLVNQDFFKKWTPEMAYVLGYFAADGCMSVNSRGAHFIEFTSTDKEQIERIREKMQSSHVIGRFVSKNPRWKTGYRLQIGSKEMFNDLLRLGLTPRKSLTLDLPEVPEQYFSHFVRGYFDGDGSVAFMRYFRNDRKKLVYAFRTRFISGSKIFLEKLLQKLRFFVGTKGGSLIKKQDGSFELSFSMNDSCKIFFYLYNECIAGNLFLTRKYNRFQEALKILRGGVAQLVRAQDCRS
ncbi:MAG: intein-containing protein [Parcubacteria group bacterium Gr01-1014_30]|nr:MAG: intein-containing protein [Parcubacteria group bacterium Gr01-1014_30]